MDRASTLVAHVSETLQKMSELRAFVKSAESDSLV